MPLHFITLLRVAFPGFAIVVGAQTLWRKLTGSAVDGFTNGDLAEQLPRPRKG